MSKKTLCYSVRLESLTSISDKAYKATCFNGQEDILPKSTVFGFDFDVAKSEAYWIAAWILEQKDIQYSQKKKGKPFVALPTFKNWNLKPTINWKLDCKAYTQQPFMPKKT